MAKRGRKRKTGVKRTKSGRISRAGAELRYDKGTERTQAMQALYGPDGCDAIGRAYRAGLLGEGSDAKAMLDMARQISNAYWAAYAVGPYASAIGNKTGGSMPSETPEKARRREEWLNGHLDTANGHGHAHRRNFDQLAIDVNPDCGPQWLDRLCYAARTRRAWIDPADAQALSRALDCLSEMAEVEKPRVATLKAA